MAMYHYNLNTFAEVERLYDNVKPIRTTGQVPLGDRARKWEHIHKVSKNKYVLLDELPADGKSFIWRQPLDELIKRAPVTWTRCAHTGIEKIRIRNGSGQWNHNSRYSFLMRALPRCMDFHVMGGKQYVECNRTNHYLPKSKWVHKQYYEHYASNKSQYHHTMALTKNDDGRYLDFQRDPYESHEQWVCLTERHKEPVTRTKISGEKKKYYEAIREYAEWAYIMQNILYTGDHYDWERTRRIQHQCGVALNDHDEFRNMLLDDTDERRSPVAISILGAMADYSWQDQKSTLPQDKSKFISRFKSHIDNYANFKIKYQDYK